MRIAVGVIAIGVLVGVGAVVDQRGTGNRVPSAVESASIAAGVLPSTGSNPVAVSHEREEVFEFAEKPGVRGQGTGDSRKWVVSFASKGRCDATVAIVGPDGKVLRHLASGVLGKNAPWPFKQDSLAQSVEWNGKDDFGKPAPAGCKVRVGLGLDATFDKAFGWAPNALRRMPVGMGVDASGRLYVLDWIIGKDTLKVFDRDGKYVRTVLPSPAGLPPEKMALIDWQKTTVGSRSIYRPRDGGGSGFDTYREKFLLSPCRQNIAVLPDGRLALLSSSVRKGGRKLILLDSRDGSTAPGCLAGVDVVAQASANVGQLGSGPLFIAASPDSKFLYVGGTPKLTVPDVGPTSPSHAVSRISMETPGPAAKFAGEYAAAGKDDAHFDSPCGVACDKAGNVYVADWGNDRIQVLKPDGVLLKSLPLEKPEQIAVHPKTGAIYVLSVSAKQDQVKLVKFAGLDSPNPVASFELLKNYAPVMALDAASEPAAVWVACYGGDPSLGNDISRFEDAGGGFRKTVSVKAAVPAPAGWEHWQPWSKQICVATDPLREEFYLRQNGGCFPSPAMRVDGRTGKVVKYFDWRIKVEQVAVGADGKVYMRLMDGGTKLVRYDPDADKFVPMPGGQPFVNAYKKTVEYNGEPIHGIDIPAHFGARTWQDQFGVAPNGDIYVPCGLLQQHLDALAKENAPRPERITDCSMCVLQVISPEGKFKSVSALPGLGTSCGIRVGRGGAVYMQLQCQPLGQKLPQGLAPDATHEPSEWGTLVKFNSTFDKFPIGSIVGWWAQAARGKPSPVENPTHNWSGGLKVRIENALWSYGGVLASQGSGSCTCQDSSFGLDLFERSFVPAVQTCTVNVLDANGNVVARLGGYGNADDRGAAGGPAFGVIFPHSVGVTDEAVYVHDQCNEWVVRAKLLYKKEETVSVP